MSEVYNSATRGRIPLSFTGRHLLQALRECIQDAIREQDYNCNGMALSHTRGRLAEYMSVLEGKSKPVKLIYSYNQDHRCWYDQFGNEPPTDVVLVKKEDV